MNNNLLSDKDVAKLLSVSPSWVKCQRYKRKKGLDHTLNVPPVFIGTMPRYRQEDIDKWLNDK